MKGIVNFPVGWQDQQDLFQWNRLAADMMRFQGVLMGMEEQLLMMIQVPSVFPYSDVNPVLSSICFHSSVPFII